MKKVYPYYNTPNLKNFRELSEYCKDNFGDKNVFRWLNNKNEEFAITYKQFYDDVKALGTYFIGKGYNRTHIAVIGENSYLWMLSYFAVINTNNIVVPIDKELGSLEIAAMLKRSDSSVIVYSDEYAEEVEQIDKVQKINMNSIKAIIETVQNDVSYDNVKIDNKAVCTIIYTSGTTAEPKGVMLNHKNLISDIIVTAQNFLVPQKTMLVLPLHHTYGFLAAATLPMLRGSEVFINSSLRRLMSDIKHSKPEYIAMVPVMAETILKKIWENAKAGGKDELLKKMIKISECLLKIGIDVRRKLFKSVIDGLGGNLKHIIIGGAPINASCVKEFYQLGICANGGYGISECSPIVSVVRNEEYCPESSGRPNPGVEIRVVDGEIQVKGDIVFMGYYKDEDATKDAFDGEWYKTGDLGEYKDGYLYITGRKKNIIVLSNGKNISPEEIEQILQENIPEITEVVVYDEDSVLTAEIYLSDDSKDVEDNVKKAIIETNRKLPIYKQVINVKFRDAEFPKTTTKKIMRRTVIFGGNSNASKN